MHAIDKKKAIDEYVPIVTVAIPVFRGEKYIKSAIESVLNQSYGNFELLIVDNNSDDGTEDVVRLFKDPRIRYFRNQVNVGAQENWNICLKSARGKYIKILPHDDLLEKNCLSKQVSIMEKDTLENLAFIFSSRKIIAKNEMVITKRGIPFHSSGVIGRERLIKKCILSGTNVIGEPGAVLFRASFSKKIGWFDGSTPYVIDFDYWVRLLTLGDAYYIKDSLCSFRISLDSWSAKIGFNQARQYLSFVKRIKNYDIGNISWLICYVRAYINGCARYIFFKIWV